MDTAPDDAVRENVLAGTADAIVVGAGIVGLTCALRLAEAGRDVLVVEAGSIAAGVSGYTTAKLTAGHGLVYSRLEDDAGAEAAALYARAQLAGLSFVRGLVQTHGIDCDFETQPNYVFGEEESELEELAAETAAARRAGLPAEDVDSLDLPFPARGATLLRDQAQFHPRKYLLALARQAEAAGARIVTGRRVTEILGERPLVVRAGEEEARAPVTVVATHYPIVEQGFFVPRLHPRRSYVVAAPLEQELRPGMYINAGTPTRSLRTARLPDGRRLLLVGGEGHRVGQEVETKERYGTLENYMREHFQVGETMYRWSTQDNFSVDQLPYVGDTGEVAGLYVATGFAGWGMSNGTMAGLAISASVLGEHTDWASLFALDRGHDLGSVRRLLGESANVGAQQAIGAVRSERTSVTDVGTGEGAVLSLDGEDVAISRDGDGAVHAVSPKCTHMGCVVAWNAAESSWDCPCHGSRFAPTGAVLHGPALKPLERIELDEDAMRA